MGAMPRKRHQANHQGTLPTFRVPTQVKSFWTSLDSQRVTEMSRLEKCLSALQPNHAKSYIDLAMCLETSEQFVMLLDGRSLCKQELLLEALRHTTDDSEKANIFFELAAPLIDREIQIALPDGRCLNERELYLEALLCEPNSTNSKLFMNLGLTLSNGETISLSGRSLSSRDLYLEALRANPQDHDCLPYLADCLEGDETITLPDGRSLTRRDLYLEALECDTADPHTILGALSSIPLEEAVLKDRDHYIWLLQSLPNVRLKVFKDICTVLFQTLNKCDRPEGPPLTSQQIHYLRKVLFDPNNANSLVKLGSTLLDNTATITLFDGRVLTRRQCYLAAIAVDATCARAYIHLALTLFGTNDAEITFPDGRELTCQQLYVEALAYDPTIALAYNNLAPTLGHGEQLQLRDGRLLDKHQLCLEALRHDPSFAGAYLQLAQLLDSETGDDMVSHDQGDSGPLGAVTVVGCTGRLGIRLHDERVLTKRDLYLEALRFAPSLACCYLHIAMELSENETILLHDERSLTVPQLCLEAVFHQPSLLAQKDIAGYVFDTLPVELPWRRRDHPVFGALTNTLFSTLFLSFQRLECQGLLLLAHQSMFEDMLADSWTWGDSQSLPVAARSRRTAASSEQRRKKRRR